MSAKQKPSREMMYLLEEYKRIHPDAEAIDPSDVANWAYNTGKWNPVPIDPRQTLRRQLSQALRQQYYVDPQGREVRENHHIVIGDRDHRSDLWINHRTAKPEQMHLSLQQRRGGILADCKQHKTDADSYNDNNTYGATLPLFDYNFNPDLEEASQPTKYPDEPPNQI
jgi:hypothetical protein